MFLSIPFFNEVNYAAVFVAALAYFILGALWYSVLFQKIWSKGITEMGIKMAMPDKGKMGMMMLKSFLANLLCAFALAFIIRLDAAYRLETGIKLGIVCGAGITLASQMMGANWIGTKRSVLMVDAAYQILGVILCCVIISVWH